MTDLWNTLPTITEPELQRLADLITRYGPITGKRLAIIMGTSRRRISDLVRSLVMDYGVPIGGKMDGRKGYYLIRDTEEKCRELAALGSRVKEIAARMRALTGIPESRLMQDLFGGNP